MCLKRFFQYGKSDYAQLMPASFKHWKAIEEKSGKKLFTSAGIMNIRKDNVMKTILNCCQYFKSFTVSDSDKYRTRVQRHHRCTA